MASFELNKLQQSVQASIAGATSVSLLGGDQRRNSYTFKVILSDGKTIVVKVIKNKLNFESKINDEKKSLKAIDHIPDIKVSKMIDCGEVSYKKMSYIAFDYYDGVELGRYIKGEGQVGEAETKRFLNQLVLTIKQLALAGIIHQDVKPDNIIRLPNGEYILLDLGIARFSNLDAKLVKQQGPAMYLSKEQIDLGIEKIPSNQRRITFLSDLNSLGIVALNMLMGQQFYTQWERDRRIEASARIRDEELGNIEDTELRGLIAALLEANPSTRLRELSKATDMSQFSTSVGSLLPHWSLHKSTGLTFLEEIAAENPELKMGLVITGETVQSISKLRTTLDKFHANGWKTTIDPSTHKLLFDSSHHAYLRARDYYVEDLSLERFYEPQFTRGFVSNVLEFQKGLGVSYYISPYFYTNKAESQAMSATLSLYEEARRQLQEKEDSTELMMGLSFSKGLIKDPIELSKVLDQIVMLNNCDLVYINLELVKKSNSPCSDVEYIRGLIQIASTLSLTKRVILSGIDQSSLLIFSRSKVSIALNPHISYRKNDVDDKLSSESGPGGGPKSEDKRQKVYIPELMNDLDITRDLQDPGFVSLNKTLKLGNSSSKYFSQAQGITNEKARNKHFTLAFDAQIREFLPLGQKPAMALMANKVKVAKDFYTQIESHQVLLDRDSVGDFLDNWSNV